MDGINTFSCNCSAGYHGKTCRNGTDECSPNPCRNGGNCTDIHLDYNVRAQLLTKSSSFASSIIQQFCLELAMLT